MAIEADLLHEGMGIVEVVSKRIARRLGGHAELDDLRGIGRLALLTVVRSYDPDRSAFASYASKKLKWAIFDEVRRGTHGRAAAARLNAVMASERLADGAPGGDEPTSMEGCQARLTALLEDQAAALAMGLATAPSDVMRVADDAGTPEDATARAETAEVLRGAVGTLPDRERTLIERHYFGGEPFDEIAGDLGISKSWASRLHGAAIDKLGKALREPAFR